MQIKMRLDVDFGCYGVKCPRFHAAKAQVTHTALKYFFMVSSDICYAKMKPETIPRIHI